MLPVVALQIASVILTQPLADAPGSVNSHQDRSSLLRQDPVPESGIVVGTIPAVVARIRVCDQLRLAANLIDQSNQPP
jgi:hypothetical protein